MTKLRGPLLSLGATGGLAKLFSLARRMGRHIIERKPIPVDAKSPAQLFNRHMFTKCTALWHLLSKAEKAEWERLATLRHMPGYAWFISQCLRPNPGIYLPLQGGTMSGDIDMDSSRILNLLDPVLAQEAATKAYADTHGMQAHEATHVSGGADDIDSALAIAAMADLATGKIWIGNGAGRPFPINFPAAGAVLTVAETEVFNGASPVAWTDLDLSGTVGANAALVLLKVYCGPQNKTYAFRKNGDTDEAYRINVHGGCSILDNFAAVWSTVLVPTDTNGKIEWKSETALTTTIDIITYIK